MILAGSLSTQNILWVCIWDKRVHASSWGIHKRLCAYESRKGVCVYVSLLEKVKSSASPERSSWQRGWILLVLQYQCILGNAFPPWGMPNQLYKVLSSPIMEGQEKLSLLAEGINLGQKQIMLFVEMAPIQTVSLVRAEWFLAIGISLGSWACSCQTENARELALAACRFQGEVLKCHHDAPWLWHCSLELVSWRAAAARGEDDK